MVAPKIVSAPDPPASYADDGVQRGHPGGPLRRHTAPGGWMAPVLRYTIGWMGYTIGWTSEST
jgi:hypothetical protein